MQSYQRFQCIGHMGFKGLSNAVTNTHPLLPSMGTTRQKSSCRNGLQNGPRLLSRVKAGTHSPSPTGSHTAAYTPKQGTFRMGALLLPSERFTRFGNPAWPGIRTANFAAFGSWPRVLPKNAESLRNSDALMRVAVPRRRGPAGLRDFFAFVEVAACTPYSRNFFQFSRRSSLCCSCASYVSARFFSARS